MATARSDAAAREDADGRSSSGSCTRIGGAAGRGREVSTPKQARAVLLYAVGNDRKHCAEAGRKLKPRWVDPCSSARQLDGWKQRVRLEPGVVAAPQSWLLRAGWKRHGRLDAHAVPGSSAP